MQRKLGENINMIGKRIVEANKVARKAFKNWEIPILQYFVHTDSKRIFGMKRKTQTPCSCFMCGHRRKWEGLTMQERKLKLTEGDG